MIYKTICYSISLVWFGVLRTESSPHEGYSEALPWSYAIPASQSHKMPEAVKSQIPQFLTWNRRKTVMSQVCPHSWLSWCLEGLSNSVLPTQWYHHKLRLESKCTNCKGLVAAQVSRVEHQQPLKQPAVVHRAPQAGATRSLLIPG